MPRDADNEPGPEQPTTLIRKVDSEPEKIGEVFHDLLGIKRRFRKLKSFFKTRSRIKKGEYLFDRTTNEIRQDELMGPLTFNIYSSTIAAAIALVVTKIFNFFFPNNEPSTLPAGNSVVAEYLRVLPHVEGFLSPFLVPLTFLFIAYWISWGTIRESEPAFTSISHEALSRLPPSRIRGRNAFLYFDGAFGLIPQTALSLAFSMIISLPSGALLVLETPSDPTSQYVISRLIWIDIAGIVILFSALIYQGYLTYYKFPTLLFKAHGYYDPDGASKVSKPPWVKYILTAIFICPVVSISIYVLHRAIIMIIAMFLGAVFAFLHRLI